MEKSTTLITRSQAYGFCYKQEAVDSIHLGCTARRYRTIKYKPRIKWIYSNLSEFGTIIVVRAIYGRLYYSISDFEWYSWKNQQHWSQGAKLTDFVARRWRLTPFTLGCTTRSYRTVGYKSPITGICSNWFEFSTIIVDRAILGSV